jgi:predicted transcriptional regulator
MEILTKKHYTGKTVLAKMYKGEPCAVTYANRKQAYAKETQLKAAGFNCYVMQCGRPLVIAIQTDAERAAEYLKEHGTAVMICPNDNCDSRAVIVTSDEPLLECEYCETPMILHNQQEPTK